jgi:hypothetical protein
MPVGGETEVLTFKANMSDLHKKLAELPGLTDKEAKKMVRSLERQLKKTEKAAAKAAKNSGRSMKEMEKSLRQAQRRIQKMGAAATAISPAFGAMVTNAGAVAGGISAMMNPVGLAIGGFVALTAATAGTTAGMVVMVRKARDLEKSLAPFAHIDGIVPEIPAAQLASLERANAAMDGLGTVAKSAVLVLAAEFAPAVEKAATLTLKFGLMALDAFQAFAQGKNVLEELAVFLGSYFIQTLTAPISVLASLIEIMGDLATAVGAKGLGKSLSEFGDKWDDFTADIARSGVELVFDGISGAVSGLDGVTGDYDARARKLIGTMTALHNKTEAVKQETYDYSSALQAMTAHLTPMRDRAREATDRISALTDSATDLTAPDLSRLEQLNLLLAQMHAEASKSTAAQLALADSIKSVNAAISEEQAAELRKQRQQQIDNLGGYLGYAQQGFSMLSSGYQVASDDAAAMVNHLTAQLAAGEAYYTDEQKKQLEARIKQQKKAAREAFEAVKVARIAEATAGGAVGVINALSANPFPSPLGIIGAAMITAATAKSIGSINKQRVSFHTAAPPDEIPATVLRTERVVNSAGRESLGDETLRRANAGQRAGAPTIRVLNTYRHRVYNDFIKEGLTMGNPISEAINADRTVGHRGNRKGV